ncbi:hypothetical protein CYY_004742 [Polysphondylium violaceum]|uniref:BZIP domain-containing protein n=1 Tax=Polysphondylium violaceum TaxID=133409 RepID=A0A8J4PVG0_9MYCE|nr:hypothetical protein CYY_004742 [Polysphondylium violaceum]
MDSHDIISSTMIPSKDELINQQQNNCSNNNNNNNNGQQQMFNSQSTFDEDIFVNCFLTDDIQLGQDQFLFNNDNLQQPQYQVIDTQQPQQYIDTQYQPTTTVAQQPMDCQSVNNTNPVEAGSSNPSSPMIVPNCSNQSPYESPEVNYDQIPNMIQYTDCLVNPFIDQIGNNNGEILNTDNANNYSGEESSSSNNMQVTETIDYQYYESPSSASLTPTNPSSPSHSSGEGSKKYSTEEKYINNKKRTNDSRVQNVVQPLSREELLKIAGKEPVKVSDIPTNSGDDERTVKKQRRLIKNRESAQLSRMRKKIYIEDLEKKISDLTDDNTSLKEEVVYLQSLVKQLAGDDFQFNNNNSGHKVIDISVNNNNNSNNYNNNSNINNINKAKNVKAAGVCLLIIFFSFGVFFQNPQQAPNFNSGSNRALASFDNIERSATTHSLLSLPSATDDSSDQVKTPRINSLDNLVLSDVPHLDLSTPTTPRSPSPKTIPTSSASSTTGGSSSSAFQQNTPTIGAKRAISPDDNSHRKRMRITSEDDYFIYDSDVEDEIQTLPMSPQLPVSPRINIDLNNNNNNNNNFNNNDENNLLDRIDINGSNLSSYIVCANSPRIVSNNITQTTENILNSNSSSPLTIGLLLPADSLNLNVDHRISDRSILEVTCQVLNIRVLNNIADSAASASTGANVDSQHSMITL